MLFVCSGSGGFFATASLNLPSGKLYSKISHRVSLESIRPNETSIPHRTFAGMPGATGMEINFLTDGNIACGLDYRKADAPQWIRQWEFPVGQVRDDRSYHRFRLKDLTPKTRYEFRPVILNPKTAKEIYGEEEAFCTLPLENSSEFSFFVISDTQFTIQKRKSLLHQFWVNRPFSKADFLVSLCDMSSQFDSFGRKYHEWGTDLLSKLS